jgi:hypothetical protein
MKPKKASMRAAYTQLRDPVHGSFLDLYTHGGKAFPTPSGMPSEATIYGMKYQVYYHSRIYAEKKKKTRLLGMVMYSQRIIFLEPTVSIHVMREALYHEIAHVYIKIAQSHSEALSKLTYQQVEDTCDVFGECILDLARNNPIFT